MVVNIIDLHYRKILLLDNELKDNLFEQILGYWDHKILQIFRFVSFLRMGS